MQVTFLSFWHPYPADSGAKMRVLALLRALARKHAVDLIVLTTEPLDTPNPEPLAEICRSITTMTVPVFSPRAGLDWRNVFRTTPRSLIATFDPAVIRLIERQIAAGACDVLICGDLAAYFGFRMARLLPVFIDELDSSRYLDAMNDAPTIRQRLRATLTWWKHRAFVRRVMHAAAGCFVASEREAALLHAIAPDAARIAIIPNGVTPTDQSDPSPGIAVHRLVYSGSVTYAPNLDAVTFFATEILPRIRLHARDVWLAVTGSAEGVSLTHLANIPGLVFTGWLSDIRTYVAASRVCVVPLRAGGGTRLKILEAMAVGTPVVSTTKGAEGLDLTNGDDVLIADTPEDFAHATIRLLTDDALRSRIIAHAKATVTAHYDWETIGTEMLAELDRLFAAWHASSTTAHG